MSKREVEDSISHWAAASPSERANSQAFLLELCDLLGVPRPAQRPAADFIAGNPPFIGKGKLREDLGDGYAETLRAAYPEVPESADFVLYSWHKAAGLVRAGQARRFGLLITNSQRQTFARRVVQFHLAPALTERRYNSRPRLQPRLRLRRGRNPRNAGDAGPRPHGPSKILWLSGAWKKKLAA